MPTETQKRLLRQLPAGVPADAWHSAVTASAPGHTPVAWYEECLNHPEPDAEGAAGGDPVLVAWDEWSETHFHAGEDAIRVCAETFAGLACAECTDAAHADGDQADCDPVWWTSEHAVGSPEAPDGN